MREAASDARTRPLRETADALSRASFELRVHSEDLRRQSDRLLLKSAELRRRGLAHLPIAAPR